MKIYLTPAERDILEHARILKDLYYPKGNPCMVKCRQVCCGYCAEAKRYQEEIVQPITKAGLYDVWCEIQEMLKSAISRNFSTKKRKSSAENFLSFRMGL